MKKLLILALVAIMTIFAGCAAQDASETNEEKPLTSNELNDTDKYFPEDKVFTAELLYDYMVRFEEYKDENGIQQTYMFDLRSADEYSKGHVYGAVNISANEGAELINKLYTDSHVFFIGEGAEELAESFRSEFNAAYAIKGGYDAIVAIEGMDKYITTEVFEHIDTRPEEDKNVESEAYHYVVTATC